MKIAIASDHAGIEMRKEIVEFLQTTGHQVVDFGAYKKCVPVDYPDYAQIVAHSLQQSKCDRGVLICGTGIGMCIAANRFNGVRAVIGTDRLIVKAREHNDVNVICFGARVQSVEEAIRCLEAFLYVESSEEQRHRKRIDKLDIIVGL